ncbi:hypothetical protein QJS04_geneDACA002377 [Acorus gramineus]|uniref:COP1-interacting protein 7 n=1 Tax=Acorus gramineus TaxID=55184 RepID=A0AAV9A907_ACOGR|nr:hypothetical protein QJS04_geneDACA002377 [Acorus gramineus]
MKSETRLDSAIFHLTPTRTRCDLFIMANGMTEKMASGLLNPFLSHLRTAQEQIKKGGYSIILKPDPGRDTLWFTKGTVERFVRFVSTPEVLERVNTVESEILQIEKAIAIQGNEGLGFSSQVEDHQTRSMANIVDNKPTLDSDVNKAIVLYKPGEHPPDSNGIITQEENSKVKLLRVLETRRVVLQKEQGMAFARAVAAGFDMDNLSYIVSFAECFGANRLMDACLRFVELWKGKHESGQWLEIEAAEAMSTRSEFSSVNATGIVFSNGIWGSESNGKTSNNPGVEMNFSSEDRRPPTESQMPVGPQEYIQGQYQHPMFPQWPMHSPQGAPVFPAYPMQGMPYYPGGGMYFQSPYPPPMEDPRFNTQQRPKRHSMDSRDSNTESDSNTRSQDGVDQIMSEVEKEVLQGRKSHRKAGRSGKKKSGVVVIRNINYVTSKRHDASGSESQSASDSETDMEGEDLHSDSSDKKHKKNSRSSKNKGTHGKSDDDMNLYHRNETSFGQEADSGHWQAFQNFLLKEEEERTRPADGGMFSTEKEAPVKRKQNTIGPDPILPPDRDFRDAHDQRITEFDRVNGKVTRSYKHNASINEVGASHEHFSGREYIRDAQQDVQISESNGGRGVYRRAINDDFLIYSRENQTTDKNSYLDPLAGNEFVRVENTENISSRDVGDDSYIVPFRSSSQDQIGTESRTAIDMYSQFPSSIQKTAESSNGVTNQLGYEPDGLSFMPQRDVERESFGYDPAMEYDIQARTEDAVLANKNQEDISANVKKNPEKEKKSKASQNGMDKRRMESTMRRGKPSKLSPQAEAQARAAKLRAYKADLQKEKKEREEEEIRRLEALKRERQKRIAARGSSSPASPLPSQLVKPRTLTKVSPGLHKGSKFTDSDPGSSSPWQKLPIRTTSTASNDSGKVTKPSRPGGSSFSGNGLSRSVSSLPDLKKERNGSTPEAKTEAVRNRRLSDPEGNNVNRASSLRSVTSSKGPKHNVSDEPQIKKISAIMSLDKTKSATLPELKIRTPKGPPNNVPNKSATKQLIQKGNGSRSSLNSEKVKSKKADETTQYNNGDDNPVIEKTVVMLETEMVAPSVVQASAEIVEVRKELQSSPTGEKTRMDSNYASIRAPPPPVTIIKMEDNRVGQLNQNIESHEVASNCTIDESKVFSTKVTEKPYQAPYARLSSVDEQRSTNLQYNEGQQTTSAISVNTTDTIKAHVSFSLDPEVIDAAPESSDKHRSKDSSKGFRRLLKFGKKSQGSSTEKSEVTEDQLPLYASNEEVHTLKNLISQDEGTSTKVSRPFSLLSPFRKTSEKKLAYA